MEEKPPTPAPSIACKRRRPCGGPRQRPASHFVELTWRLGCMTARSTSRTPSNIHDDQRNIMCTTRGEPWVACLCSSRSTPCQPWRSPSNLPGAVAASCRCGGKNEERISRAGHFAFASQQLCCDVREATNAGTKKFTKASAAPASRPERANSHKASSYPCS